MTQDPLFEAEYMLVQGKCAGVRTGEFVFDYCCLAAEYGATCYHSLTCEISDHERKGIRLSIHNLKMKMWSIRITTVADAPEHVANPYAIANLDRNAILLQVGVQRKSATADVNDGVVTPGSRERETRRHLTRSLFGRAVHYFGNCTFSHRVDKGSEIRVACKGAGITVKKTIGRIELNKVNREPLENPERTVNRKDRTPMGIQFVAASIEDHPAGTVQGRTDRYRRRLIHR